MIDLEGETEVDVFPLGTDAIEVDELVSDWCICLYVCTWFNSETEKMVFNGWIKIAWNISLHVIPWSFWKYLDRSVQIILTQNNYFRQALIVEQFFRYQLIPWWWLPDLLANLTLNDPLFHRISIAWKNVLYYWSKTINPIFITCCIKIGL